MGYWLNEPSIREPERLVAGINELADAGYGIVRIMLRNTNYTHRSPEVVAAIAAGVQAASLRGMRVALDCEPHVTLVADLGRTYPDATTDRLVRTDTQLIGGQFRVVVQVPQIGGQMAGWVGIEAAFVQRDGQWTRVDVHDLHVDWETGAYKDGDTRLHQDYAEGRPVNFGYICRFTGRVDASDGGILLFPRFADHTCADFWAPNLRRYYRELLDCYKDIALSGVGWDEPAIAGDWRTYKYSAWYAKAFRQRNGYDLADRLYLLEQSQTSPEAVRIRLDYYETLNEGLAQAQADLVAYTRELFGADALLGTHHTWQGEGGTNDYRAGAVDYFRLTDTQDAGYTDCWWWDQNSVCYAYVLGTSLGRLSPSGEAEVNTWHAKPTIGQVEYNARLISLFNLVWFNIWVGDTADTCLLNTHYTWPAMKQATKLHDSVRARLAGYKPVVDVAVLHGWEAVAGLNDERIASAHKTFCLNTSRLFTERSIAFDFIDTRLLAASTIDGRDLVNSLGRYSVLVLPYAVVLPDAAWQAVRSFADAGGRIAFNGAPPTLTTEGRDISAEFAQLAGLTKPISVDDYLHSLYSRYAVPSGRSVFLDCYVSLIGYAEKPLISVENEPHGVRSAAGNIVYLSDLDPRDRLLDLIASWLPSRLECYSDTILWRMYTNGERTLAIAISREGRKLHGIVNIGAHTVMLTEGTLALIDSNTGAVEVVSD